MHAGGGGCLYGRKSLQITCKDALQFFDVTEPVLKHLVYDGPVDIHVAVKQRVADNLRPNHAESSPCKLVAESSGMEKFTKERYIVLQNSDWRMLTRFIAIIRL
jgi:hypothetical protein